MQGTIETYYSYGNLYQYTAEVFYPKNIEELQAILAVCRANKCTITPGGSFNSFDRQNGSREVVISMKHFDEVHCDVQGGTITTGAGASWGKIVDVAHAHQCIIYTCITGSVPTAGGTLSINSCSVWTPSVGKEGTHCISFKFMTVEGKLYHCSRTENRDLFLGVIGGMGMLGFIVEITYRVLPVGSPFEIELVAEDFDDIHDLEERLYVRKSKDLSQLSNLSTQGTLFYLYKGQPRFLMGTHYYKKVDQVDKMNKWLFYSGVLASGLMRFFPKLANRVIFKDRGKPPRKRLVLSNMHHPRQGLFWAEPDYHWSKKFSRFFQRVGYEPKMYQNSYFIPLGEDKVTQFVKRTYALSQQLGLQTFMFDVLHMPKDDVPFTLSCTRDRAGFYVNTTFMEQTDRQNLMACYTELNQLAIDMGGSLNLSKNCFIEPELLEQMYAPALSEFKALKEKYDPQGLLSSDFFEHYFPNYFGKGSISSTHK